MPARKRKQPRGVVDTSVVVAGIAGLKPVEIASQNASARMLRDWIENGTFIRLVTDEIILEYKTVLARLGVRRSTIGRVEQGAADFLVTLNPRDFPRRLLAAHVILPGEKIPTTGRRKHFRNRQR